MRLAVSESRVNRAAKNSQDKIVSLKSCYELRKISVKKEKKERKLCLRCRPIGAQVLRCMEVFADSDLIYELFDKLMKDGYADISEDNRYICFFKHWDE